MRLIDGEAAKNHFAQIGEIAEYKGAICTVVPISAIDSIPTIDPDSLRPKGHWIDDGSGVIICSNCGEEHAWDDYRASFCEDCGADMRGDNNA